MKKQDLSQAPIYKHPFSVAYWKDAAKQLADVRILCVAAILIAVRVALKSIQIPVGPDLNITIGFFVNALGASIFGPVVAVVAAAISDTLGCILFPTGTYFFPFIFVEIAGSLIFALFLWRSKLSATRIILSRFFVSAVCNFIMNPTIMIWYYTWLNEGKSYAFVTVPRVVKNLALFPAEAFLLVIFLGALMPALMKLALIPKFKGKLRLARKHIILLVILAIISVAIVFGYYSLFYPTQPESASSTADDVKLTLKTDRREYVLDDMEPAAPLAFTATLKASGEDSVKTLLVDIKLTDENGKEIKGEESDNVFEEIVIDKETSRQLNDSFDYEYSKNNGFKPGKYTAVAKAVYEIDGQQKEITVRLPIKIK